MAKLTKTKSPLPPNVPGCELFCSLAAPQDSEDSGVNGSRPQRDIKLICLNRRWSNQAQWILNSVSQNELTVKVVSSCCAATALTHLCRFCLMLFGPRITLNQLTVAGDRTTPGVKVELRKKYIPLLLASKMEVFFVYMEQIIHYCCLHYVGEHPNRAGESKRQNRHWSVCCSSSPCCHVSIFWYKRFCFLGMLHILFEQFKIQIWSKERRISHSNNPTHS